MISNNMLNNPHIIEALKEHYIGQALTGEYVGLKRNQDDELELYYEPVYLGKLKEDGLEKPKGKTRKRR